MSRRSLPAVIALGALLLGACGEAAAPEAAARRSSVGVPPGPADASGPAPTPPGGGTPAGTAAPGPAPGHVHALDVDLADEAVLAATHAGLFLVDPPGERGAPHDLRRIGTSTRDLMGFAVEGPGRYLASGHPGAGEDGPALAGLIRSDDAGATWRPVSLAGEADFHGLDVAGDAVVGWSSVDGLTYRSGDGGQTWRTADLGPVVDLALVPRGVLGPADRLLLVTPDGLLESTDGGATAAPVPGAPALHDVTAAATAPGAVAGLGPEGAVWESEDGGSTWERRGSVPGRPLAMAEGFGDPVVLLSDGRLVAVDG